MKVKLKGVKTVRPTDKNGRVTHMRRSLESVVLIHLYPSDYKRLRFLAFLADRSATGYARDVLLTHIDRSMTDKHEAIVIFDEDEERERKEAND